MKFDVKLDPIATWVRIIVGPIVYRPKLAQRVRVRLPETDLFTEIARNLVREIDMENSLYCIALVSFHTAMSNHRSGFSSFCS